VQESQQSTVNSQQPTANRQPPTANELLPSPHSHPSSSPFNKNLIKTSINIILFLLSLFRFRSLSLQSTISVSSRPRELHPASNIQVFFWTLIHSAHPLRLLPCYLTILLLPLLPYHLCAAPLQIYHSRRIYHIP
jgi:hypothetical protein